MLLSDTIGVFENIFSVEECNLMIDRFESAKAENAGYVGESGAGLDYNIKRTYDYDLMSDDSRNYKWRDIILTRWNSTLTNEYLSKFPYIENFDHNNVVNGKTYYESLQMQKYDKGLGHYNAWHVETENWRTSRRMFVFMIYLNTISEGGRTLFNFKNPGEQDFFSVQPKAGTVVIWPASWPYVHKGEVPLSGDKYIITTWLSYDPEEITIKPY